VEDVSKSDRFGEPRRPRKPAYDRMDPAPENYRKANTAVLACELLRATSLLLAAVRNAPPSILPRRPPCAWLATGRLPPSLDLHAAEGLGIGSYEMGQLGGQ
jgi:hypothetical protein